MFRIIILVVALAAGGSAAWLMVATRREPPAPAPIARAPEPTIATVEVLVAAGPVEPGQTLTRDNLRWQKWPESGVSPSFILRDAQQDMVEKLSGSIVRMRLLDREPVQADKLGALNAGMLSALLPSGKRAVAVRITAENTAGGFILPNDRVDVLHTISEDGVKGGAKRHASRTILQNVVVLAIDQALDPVSDEQRKPRPAAIGKTATLQLTPAQSEIVTEAEASGTLSLALRPAKDNAEAPIPQAAAYSTIRVVRGGRTEMIRVPTPRSGEGLASASQDWPQRTGL